eukprot:2512016-Pyramimonas_sp.AAC.1
MLCRGMFACRAVLFRPGLWRCKTDVPCRDTSAWPGRAQAPRRAHVPCHAESAGRAVNPSWDVENMPPARCAVSRRVWFAKYEAVAVPCRFWSS